MRILNVIICFFAISTCAHVAGSSKVAPMDFAGIVPGIACAAPERAGLLRRFIRAAKNVAAMAFSGSAIKIASEERHTTALMTAVLAEENTLVKELANSQHLINIQDTNGMTALMYAAKNGNLTALKTLIEHAADPERVSTATNKTALHFAAETAHCEAIQALVDAGANTNAQDSLGNTPLMLTIVARENQKTLYKRSVPLVANSMNLEQRNNEGQTALWLAARGLHEQLLKYLMSKGAALQTRDNDKTSALEAAAGAGMTEAVITRILKHETRLMAQRHDAALLASISETGQKTQRNSDQRAPSA